jgi:hypothetical protein
MIANVALNDQRIQTTTLSSAEVIHLKTVNYGVRNVTVAVTVRFKIPGMKMAISDTKSEPLNLVTTSSAF